MSFFLACVAGAKRGGGGGREKGKREGSACSKSLCFCITPTNFLVSDYTYCQSSVTTLANQNARWNPVVTRKFIWFAGNSRCINIYQSEKFSLLDNQKFNVEMSVTPTNSSKRGRKKDGGCNDHCRFCSCSFENSDTRASFENLFSKSARKESPGTVLADCCLSMGFPLI